MEKKRKGQARSGRRRAADEHAEVKALDTPERLDVIKSLLAAGLERMIDDAQTAAAEREEATS